MRGRPSQDSTDLPLLCDKRPRRRRRTLGAHMLSLTLMAQLPSIFSVWEKRTKKKTCTSTDSRTRRAGDQLCIEPLLQNQKSHFRVAPYFS